MDLSCTIGPVRLRSPLIAASGTVGAVFDFAPVGALESYGAAVAKSVSGEPWEGRPPPRLAPTGAGLLNGIGIPNPGIDRWVSEVGPHLGEAGVPVWGSAVGNSVEEFVRVAKGLGSTSVEAVEINLSCPNLERGIMFALDAESSGEVVRAVRGAIDLPLGVKLSPNASDIVEVAASVHAAGADWVVLTNTIWGAAIDPDTRRPALSGVVGGYSGPPLKPIALRCVWEVAEALPGFPIVGCGGVSTGRDATEYLLAGASAVALGTVHFAEPRAGRRVLAELTSHCRRQGVESPAELVGAWRR